MYAIRSYYVNELKKHGLIKQDAKCVAGTTIGVAVKDTLIYDSTVIKSFDAPHSHQGGIAVLRGNIAPDGCVVKQSAVAPEMMVHSGPARVFDGEEATIKAIYDVV